MTCSTKACPDPGCPIAGGYCPEIDGEGHCSFCPDYQDGKCVCRDRARIEAERQVVEAAKRAYQDHLRYAGLQSGRQDAAELEAAYLACLKSCDTLCAACAALAALKEARG